MLGEEDRAQVFVYYGFMASIFRAYDVRGRYPSEINERIVSDIAHGLTHFFPQGALLVGHDARLSSPKLYRAVLQGLSARSKVLPIGIATTPMFYFLVNHLKGVGGIMVTASHNPKEFNGLKVVRAGAMPVNGREIHAFLSKHPQKTLVISRKASGKLRRDFIGLYARFLQRFIKVSSPLTVVFDSSNGTTGLVLKRLFRKRGIKALFLNAVLNGQFPGHGPNPLKGNATMDARRAVLKHNADLGVVFDADGDRVAFVDEHGRRVDSDYIVYLLTTRFKPPYVIDVAEGRAPLQWISHNIHLIESRVGYFFIKRLMKEKKVEFAAEHSGHYYYKDFFYSESGILTALFVINELSRLKEQGMSLGDWLSTLPKHYTSREHQFRIDDFHVLVQRLERHYGKKAEHISHKDGLTVTFPDFWFNVRLSNTESLARLNVEAKTRRTLQRALTMLQREIKVEKP